MNRSATAIRQLRDVASAKVRGRKQVCCCKASSFRQLLLLVADSSKLLDVDRQVVSATPLHNFKNALNMLECLSQAVAFCWFGKSKHHCSFLKDKRTDGPLAAVSKRDHCCGVRGSNLLIVMTRGPEVYV